VVLAGDFAIIFLQAISEFPERLDQLCQVETMDCSPLESRAPCVAASINGKGVLLEILS
jgi:hypothetical protein